MCGDSTSEKDVAKLMAGEKADMVFTDPPYNAGFKKNQIANDNFQKIEDFLDFTNKWFLLSLKQCHDDSSIYVWGFEKTICEIKVSFNKYEDIELTNMIVWDKVSFGKTLPKFKSGKEICLFYKKGNPIFNNQRMKARPSLAEKWGHLADKNGDVKQGKNSCNIYEGPCTDVWWDIPNMGRGGNKEYLGEHPTQKPLMACERSILSSSNENHLVIDLFLGSGSTLIACEKTNRRCYGMELDEHYMSVIIKRFEEYSGETAVRLAHA
jgi:DNA modification methylase